MAAIKDVAAHAGLSVSAVSKYLKNPNSVREDTRTRVEKAIRDLNYIPSLAARALRTGHTNMILLLIPEMKDLKTNYLLNAIQSILSKRGMAVVLLPERTLETLYQSSGALSAYPVDGVLVFYPINIEQIKRFVREIPNIPKVVVGHPIWEDTSTFLWDIGKPAYLVTRHLLELGHQRIGFIGIPPRSPFFKKRFNQEGNFRQALMDADAPLYESLIFRGTQTGRGGDFDYQLGIEGIQYLMDRDNPPTAVVATTEDTAIGCLNWALSRGISVPRELAIACCDESVVSSRLYPPLTSVHTPVLETAQLALEKLFAMIDGTDDGEVSMVWPVDAPTVLHVRRSTDPSAPLFCE